MGTLRFRTTSGRAHLLVRPPEELGAALGGLVAHRRLSATGVMGVDLIAVALCGRAAWVTDAARPAHRARGAKTAPAHQLRGELLVGVGDILPKVKAGKIHAPASLARAVLALLDAIAANCLAAVGLAELLSWRRSCERIAEALARWSRAT